MDMLRQMTMFALFYFDHSNMYDVPINPVCVCLGDLPIMQYCGRCMCNVHLCSDVFCVSNQHIIRRGLYHSLHTINRVINFLVSAIVYHFVPAHFQPPICTQSIGSLLCLGLPRCCLQCGCTMRRALARATSARDFDKFTF